MNYQNILVAIDLGQQSLYIAQQAVQLANVFSAHLKLMHIIEPPMSYTIDYSSHEKWIQKKQSESEKSLNALSKRLNYEKMELLTAIGSPQDEILRVAHSDRVDLILVGSHGMGGYSHLLGSTAHQVLSFSPCDVLIVQVSHLQDQLKMEPSQTYLWESPLPQEATQAKTPRFEGPPHGGSVHGFGENISRGPRLVHRPNHYPYKGGHKPSADEKSEDSDSTGK